MFRRSYSASAALHAKCGFAGLGNMGKHMATNLLKAGHEVTVFDVFPEPMNALKSLGASTASSPAALAENADILITMLPSSPHVKEVFETGFFKSAKAGALLIDCSTIDPNVTRALHAQATEKKLRMVDAPVSGGVGGAEAGTLTFMVGGSAPDFEEAKAILQAMGKNIVHCGGSGTGEVAKICNNLILGISMAAVSEAMNMGVQMGADPKTLAGIINTSSGRCWSSEVYNPVPGVLPNVPASRNYTGGFGAPLMTKDLALASDAAKAAGIPLPVGDATLARYREMIAQGLGDRDFSAMYAFLAGMQLPK